MLIKINKKLNDKLHLFLLLLHVARITITFKQGLCDKRMLLVRKIMSVSLILLPDVHNNI